MKEQAATKTVTAKAVEKVQESKTIQGLTSDVKVYFNADRETITHVMAENMKMELHVNLYKKLLEIPFQRKERDRKAEGEKRPVVYGLIAKPSVYLSQDGQYLVHRVLGVRVSKHINYYKRILRVDFTPVVNGPAKMA